MFEAKAKLFSKAITSYYTNLYDLPLCIVNNDNLMTFGGYVVYLWPE